jgi:GH25 family lysozyme M1 (1,4-beta-N-acetylmuramidase)
MKAMFENGNHAKESSFDRNYEGSIGLKRGAYLYSIARTIADAHKEAVDFVNILNKRKLEYGVWLDYEDNKIRGLGKVELTKHIDEQARVIREAGYDVGIYTNPSWYLNYIDGAGLSRRYDMWVARYPLADNGTIKEKLKPSQYNAKIWQYSSKGKVPGIRGNCDLDIEMADLETPKDSTETPIRYPIPTRNLKKGSKGDDVKWLQVELSKVGYGLTVDGIFGPKTDSAVRDYQKKNGLMVDGIVGAITRSSLLKH